MFKKKVLSRSLALAFGGVATLAAGPVAAQGEVQELKRVEVTGSNIRRTDAETASPVQVLTRDEIQRSGKATVAEFLQTLTADGSGSIPSGFGSGFAAGGTAISLRGLGAGSTLVLLNGRRMAPYGLADDGQKVFTDLSTIPMEAIERIEVLKDGASAIYGSDAIAGVVNVILRQQYAGLTAQGSYGVSRYGDGAVKKGALLWGTGDLEKDRYNLFIDVEASKTDPIWYRDRNRQWIGADLRPYGYDLASSTLGGFIPEGGTTATSSPVGNIRLPNGQYASLPGCDRFPAVLPPDPKGGCLWNGSRFQTMQPAEETFSLFSRGTLQLEGSLQAYAEASFAHKKTFDSDTPSGVSGAWGYPGGPVNASSGPGAVVLAPSHPDNVLGGDRLRYAAFDVEPRVNDTTNRFVRLLAGVKGSVADWDVDAGVLHSGTRLVSERNGYLRYSAVRAALGDPASTLFPWRIGANASLNSPALYAAISPTLYAHAKSSTDIADVKASRELAQLPGGALGLAVGAEYRRESTELTPTTYTDVGDVIGLGYSAYEGRRNSWATYAEVLAPVWKTLELSAALRHDKYLGGPSATTPKLGIKWTPSPVIAFRGTYAQGFRAPNAAESGRGGLAAYVVTRDPVRCITGSEVDCQAQIAVITRPNPALQPEKSKSATLGFVLEPISGSNVALDWWQIKRTHEIVTTDPSQAIAAGDVIRADNDLPGVPNSGTLLAANASYENASYTLVKGWDLDVRSRHSLGEAGRLTVGATWTHTASFLRVDADGSRSQYAGTHGNCDVTNCIGTPKDKGTFSVTWETGPWQFGTNVNYIGPMRNIDEASQEVCNNLFADGSDAPGGCRIASFTTFDVSGRYRFRKNLEVFGSIQNLFDKVAPLDPHTYGAANFNPMHVSGAIGRFFTLGLKYQFF